MPLVINSLGRGHTNTHTQTRIPMIRTGSILRNQTHAGLWLACAWFKNAWSPYTLGDFCLKPIIVSSKVTSCCMQLVIAVIYVRCLKQAILKAI